MFSIIVVTPASHAEQKLTFLSPDYYEIYEAKVSNVLNAIRLRQGLIIN